MKDISAIIRLLRKEIGQSKAVVSYREPFKVLVSTVLSQRTRDENTVKASAQLFACFSTPKQISEAKLSEIQKLIKPSGFFKVKAKRIKQISEEILERFQGKTPNNLDDLLSLPGVGRKTANCVLAYAYQTPSIPVDVHVHRISNRLGLVKTRIPEQTEQALMKLIPKSYWIEVNELMVKFGQKKCKPIKPKCIECSLKNHCDFAKKSLAKIK